MPKCHSLYVSIFSDGELDEISRSKESHMENFHCHLCFTFVNQSGMIHISSHSWCESAHLQISPTIYTGQGCGITICKRNGVRRITKNVELEQTARGHLFYLFALRQDQISQPIPDRYSFHLSSKSLKMGMLHVQASWKKRPCDLLLKKVQKNKDIRKTTTMHILYKTPTSHLFVFVESIHNFTDGYITSLKHSVHH